MPRDGGSVSLIAVGPAMSSIMTPRAASQWVEAASSSAAHETFPIAREAGPWSGRRQATVRLEGGIRGGT